MGLNTRIALQKGTLYSTFGSCEAGIFVTHALPLLKGIYPGTFSHMGYFLSNTFPDCLCHIYFRPLPFRPRPL